MILHLWFLPEQDGFTCQVRELATEQYNSAHHCEVHCRDAEFNLRAATAKDRAEVRTLVRKEFHALLC